ncbi:MAG TPA: hypothetical protein VF062_08205, partial [Candidatus Limnocylindrales bacterium]
MRGRRLTVSALTILAAVIGLPSAASAAPLEVTLACTSTLVSSSSFGFNFPQGVIRCGVEVVPAPEGPKTIDWTGTGDPFSLLARNKE